MKSSIMSVKQRLSAFAAIGAALLAPGFAWAAEYTEGMNSITLTVQVDGETNTLAEAIAAYNTANGTSYTVDSFNGGELKDYALIKDGDGTLKMDTAIPNFTGPVVINDGVLKCMCTEALGADTFDSHVYVRDGATFYCRRLSSKADGEINLNRKRFLHVVGDGHNGQGALNVDPVRPETYNTSGIYGSSLSLDGNTTVNHPNWAELPATNYLNGFTMVVKSGAISTEEAYGRYCNATFHARRLVGPGKMVIDDSIYYLQSNQFVDGDGPSEIEIRDNGGFRFWSSAYNKSYDWPFRFTGDVGWFWGDNVNNSMRFKVTGAQNVTFSNGDLNRVRNPVILDGPNGTTLKLRTQSGLSDNWVFFESPISGKGGINLECRAASYPAGRVSLLNPENSFVGTVTVDKGLLYVYEPGTLPQSADLVVSRSHALNYQLQKPNDVLEYYGAEFLSPNPQTLGPLTFTSVADAGTYHSGRIQGGCGTFSRIDKLSPNTMEYYSGIGAPLLNVEEGAFKLPRGPAPGLWEGTNSVNGGVFSKDIATTNLIARGPNILNVPLLSHFGAKASSTATYTGYIWNRTGADASWKFAMGCEQYVRMDIDGVEAMRQYRKVNPVAGDPELDPEHKFQTVTLTPGPHLVHIRAYVNKLYFATNGVSIWPKNFGFVYDKQNRDVPAVVSDVDTNNFEIVQDPGDGSLFTRSIDEADLPHFDEMRFARGTTFDLNGNAYVAGTLSGLPNVISSAEDAMAAPSLTITNRFIVDAADIAYDPTLKISIDAIEFGANAGVTVTNLATLARGTYTLAEATNSEGVVVAAGFRQRCKLDSNKWDVKLSNDGKKLLLAPSPGFKISLR